MDWSTNEVSDGRKKVWIVRLTIKNVVDSLLDMNAANHEDASQRCRCGHAPGSHAGGKGYCRLRLRCRCEAYEPSTAPAASLPVVDGAEFRLIPGFAGYAIGNDGSVWSRRTSAGPSGAWWRPVAVKVGRRNYARVSLSIQGRRSFLPVAHLVLAAFVGPRPDGAEACHFPDSNPLNNRVDNLRWDTHIANIGDKQIHGTMARGSGNGKSKLDEAQIRELRRLRAQEGLTYAELGARFGISLGQVGQIVLRKCWTHV